MVVTQQICTKESQTNSSIREGTNNSIREEGSNNREVGVAVVEDLQEAINETSTIKEEEEDTILSFRVDVVVVAAAAAADDFKEGEEVGETISVGGVVGEGVVTKKAKKLIEVKVSNGY